MKVVSNASPLINLAAIDELDLLRRLYGRITIPKAVWAEIVRHPPLVALLSEDLDLGEAESIALARELGAHLVLIDELRARRCAKLMGLRFTGLVGVLIEAARKGLIADLGGTLRELRQRAGFRLTDDVIREALRLARQ